MPGMNIYVPDDMRARMEAFEEVNWSGIAQAAFLRELNLRTWSTPMSETVKRLKTSKAIFEADEAKSGLCDGRIWAEKHAEWNELNRLANASMLDEWGQDEPLDQLNQAVNADGEMNQRELLEHLFGVKEEPSDAYLKAFVEGAVTVFEEVCDAVESDEVLEPAAETPETAA